MNIWLQFEEILNKADSRICVHDLVEAHVFSFLWKVARSRSPGKFASSVFNF